MKRTKERLHRVMIIGGTPAGIAAANKLGELGVPVTLVDTEPDLDAKLSAGRWELKSGLPMNHAYRPGLIRIMRNPSIDCLLPATISGIKHSRQGFTVTVTRNPTYITDDTCTLCGKCIQECPVSVDGTRKAIWAASRQSLPGRPAIDKRKTPACSSACPLGVNVQGYMALAGKGLFQKALDLIREKNVLPGICGRICTHPCEADCRRTELEGAVAIRDIKRFLADQETGTGQAPVITPVPPNGKSVAVVGSGPAGLAAAADLARHGCSVTLIEKQPMAGGLLRYGIGPHRLPRTILDRELDYIRAHGVRINTGCTVDLSNQGLQQLKQNHDAVLLAIGAWKDRTLGVPGETLKGVEGCISYLSRFHSATPPETGRNVVVIGDGNAAFDLARTLRRTKANVRIVSWFPREMIPADDEEIAGAEKEGVTIITQASVVEFTGPDGRLEHVCCKHTRPGQPDAYGIAWPEIIQDQQGFVLDADQAFVAIGQTGSLEITPSPQGLSATPQGYVKRLEYRTGIDGIYAAGDMATGPSTVVHAMAEGRAAAAALISGLGAIADTAAESFQRPRTKAYDPVLTDGPVVARVQAGISLPANPTLTFQETVQALTLEQAMVETSRCLQCGVCSECTLCLDQCGAGAVNHQDSELISMEHAGALIVADPLMLPHTIKGDDVIRSYGPANSSTDTAAMMVRGFAAAASAVMLLQKTLPRRKGHGISFAAPDPLISTDDLRIGVFVCRCNTSLGWSPDLDTAIRAMAASPRVVHAGTIDSACVEQGIADILRTVRKQAINRIVLASCVCCPLNFVCTSCTDQKSRLKHRLFTGTGISRSMVETCNIRGEALALLSRNPRLAAERFTGLLNRSVRRATSLKSFSTPLRNYNLTFAVIGQSEASQTAALTLGSFGSDVIVLGSGKSPLDLRVDNPNVHCFQRSSVTEMSGSLGDFQITATIDGEPRTFHAGAVIIQENILKRLRYHHQEGLPDRTVITAMQEKDRTGIPFLTPGMTSVSGLFLSDPPGISVSGRQKGAAAATHAAAIMPREPRQSKGYTVAVDTKLCRGCGRCLGECTYQAVTLNPNAMGGWTASIDESLCKGCGNCISVCPTNAVDSPYRSQTFLEKGLEEILV